MKRLSVEQLQSKSDCAIIDVREYPEFAGGAIAGASPIPLNSLKGKAATWDRGARYVLVCKSGKRSEQGAAALAAMGFSDIAMLEGGTEAWIRAGLPVQRAARRPWSLERQVRAIAGTLVVASSALGLWVSSWFFALTMLVGCGLLIAGVTDLCLMAAVLGKLPWNRPLLEANPGCGAAAKIS